MLPIEKPFEPRFINLDWLFNQVYSIFYWFYSRLDYYIFGGALGSGGEGIPSGSSFFDYSPFFSSLKTILPVLAIFFIAVIIYSLVRIYEIRKEEKEKLKAIVFFPPEDLPKNERWQMVLDRVNSMNPSDWKLAILEADNMLDEMIRKMGYRGENLGERLKAIEPSDFTNIQNAWEAHKVRNKIAHEGSEFFLSHREARRIVGLYEQVFKEFEFI